MMMKIKKYLEIRQSITENETNLNNSGGLMTEKEKPNNMNELSSLNSSLPPKYMERFDMCNDIIKELEIKLSRLQENQQKRLVPKFDDDENKKLDKEISILVQEMTNKLKKCEDNIKQMLSESTESSLEEQIKINMKQSIFTKLSEFTKKI